MTVGTTKVGNKVPHSKQVLLVWSRILSLG